jgi:hypothetical protein
VQLGEKAHMKVHINAKHPAPNIGQDIIGKGTENYRREDAHQESLGSAF